MNAPGNAAVLWTGGKDSALALHEMQDVGWDIRCLITFAPPDPNFLAHPLPVLQAQARALDLPHHVLEVRPPFHDSYVEHIRSLKEDWRLDALITGDIAEVGGAPNWVRECSRPSGMNILTPLWGRDRLTVLKTLLARRFHVIFSCVKQPWFTAGWVNRKLDMDAIEELQAIRTRTGLDLCGEEGEYHSLVLNAPMFRHPVHLASSAVCETRGMFHMDVQAAM